MSKERTQWDKIDLIMALACFVLGFLFIRWVFVAPYGWGVSLFTVLYFGAVISYSKLKKIKLSDESWFWAGVLLLIATSYALWEGHNLTGLRFLLLFMTAVYWLLLINSSIKGGKTSDWLLLDVLSGMIPQPLSRLHVQYVCISQFISRKVHLRSNAVFSILGALIAALFIIILWPLFMEADAGGFRDLLMSLNLYPLRLDNIDFVLIQQIIFMFPVAAYMFALITKSQHTPIDISKEELIKLPGRIKILPEATVLTAIFILNVFYVVFFVTQAPYYFSAFQGLIPEGWTSYADFARRGFFELVAISFLNLIFIGFSHQFINETGRMSKLFKILVSTLSLSSIFLTVTATARLILYVDRFGLTFMRVLPAVFMLFLTIVSLGVIVKQIKNISIMRLAAFSGAILICALFIVNVEGFITGYNAGRYLDGTLDEFDTVVLWEAKTAGIPAAIRVLKETDDSDLQFELRSYLQEAQQGMVWKTRGTHHDTLQHVIARRLLRENAEIIEMPAD